MQDYADGWYRVTDTGRPSINMIVWVQGGRNTFTNNRVDWSIKAGYVYEPVVVLSMSSEQAVLIRGLLLQEKARLEALQRDWDWVGRRKVLYAVNAALSALEKKE